VPDPGHRSGAVQVLTVRTLFQERPGAVDPGIAVRRSATDRGGREEWVNQTLKLRSELSDHESLTERP
jgi:hypothetical protein